jgi:hypothetical protein
VEKKNPEPDDGFVGQLRFFMASPVVFNSSSGRIAPFIVPFSWHQIDFLFPTIVAPYNQQ